MEYENGDKKYSKEKKHKSSDDYKDDDEYYYKMKQKYKDKERNYKDYKHKDRRDREKEYYSDREKKEKMRDRDSEKYYKYKDSKGRSRRHSKNRSVTPPHKRDRSSRSRSRSRSRSSHRSHSRQLASSYSSSSKWKYDDKRYESSYSRSKDIPEPAFSQNKGQRKMMILEKLGIDLVVPGNMEKSQSGKPSATTDSGQKTVTVTGELASYCNITPANSKMIMDRLNRKKLLWTNKTNEPKPNLEEKDGANAAAKGTAVWQSAIFSKDGDSKQTAKFKRLMGIKDGEVSESKPNTSTAGGNKDLIKRQEEMFQNMEMQYEVARASTHTHRGIGLGFGIHQYPR